MKKLICFLPLSLLLYSAIAQVSFAPFVNYPIHGTKTDHVAAGDFNNDGLQDVVVGTGVETTPGYQNANKILVYLQDPTTHCLLPPALYPYPQAASLIQAIASGDVDNDGLCDIVVGYENNLAIFRQNTAGTFGAPLIVYAGPTVDAIKIGDVNNDGLNDIAISLWNSANIAIIFGDNPVNLGITFYYPATLAGYDDLEIVKLGNSNINSIVKWHGQGLNPRCAIYHIGINRLLDSMTYVSFPTSSYGTAGIACGDIYGNGRNEIVYGKQWTFPSIGIWSNVSQSTPDTLLSISNNTGALAIADLNCDGRGDIVMVNSGNQAVTVISNFIAYTFPIPCPHTTWPDCVAIADVNNDGKMDIVSATASTGLSVLLNTTPCITVLPISLIAFEAKPEENRSVAVHWVTASEINNSYFAVERSADGRNWEIVSTVNGCGTCTQEHTYDFSDKSPLSGISYYRLKQVDFDGKYSYSDIAAVSIEKGYGIQISFDPLLESVAISGLSPDMQVEIYDMKGLLIWHNYAAQPLMQITASNFRKGCYIVRIRGQHVDFSSKLIF